MSKAYFQLKDEFVDFFVKYSGENLQSRFFVRTNSRRSPWAATSSTRKKRITLLKLLKDKPKTATHILLYGAAGTGKKAMQGGWPEAPGAHLRDRTRPGEQDGNHPDSRLCLSQHDEQGQRLHHHRGRGRQRAEHPGGMADQGETQDKGWLNELMEVPDARIIWITNTIENIEPSVRRRFAYSIHFRPFSRKQRARLWESVLKQNRVKGCYSRDQLDQLAGDTK